MGKYFKALKQAVKATVDYGGIDTYTVSGKEFACTFCGNNHFEDGRAQLNSAGMTLAGLDWVDKSAYILVCKDCG